MTLATGHGDNAIEAAPASDLDGLAEMIGVGRLANNHLIETFARRMQRFHQLDGAIDRRAFFIAGHQKGNGAGRRAILIEIMTGGGDEGGNRAFHVRRSASPKHAVFEIAGEGAARPAVFVADGDHIGVTGKGQNRCRASQPGIEIVDIAKRVARTDKPHWLQSSLQYVECGPAIGRDRLGADQLLGEGEGVRHDKKFRIASRDRVEAYT